MQFSSAGRKPSLYCIVNRLKKKAPSCFQDAGLSQPDSGVVQEPLLEGGDGADVSGAPELWEDHICECDSSKFLCDAHHRTHKAAKSPYF